MRSLPIVRICLVLFPALTILQTGLASDDQGPKSSARETTLQAGVGRVEITDHAAGPVNDPSYVKALAVSDGSTTAVIVTVDAVAIGEIGRIGNTYLPSVRGIAERRDCPREHSRQCQSLPQRRAW